MNATTPHEIIAMTGEEYPDLKKSRTKWRASSRRNANLSPGKIVYGTKSGDIFVPFRAEQGRLR